MSEKWTDFPAAVAATASDVLVGLAGGTVNARFNVSSLLLVAQNLADVADPTEAFDNLSPLTTNGDTMYYNGTHNIRLAIGTTGYIYQVDGANHPAWVANPGLLIAQNLADLNDAAVARTNIGLGTAASPTFVGITTTGLNKISVANALTAFSGGGQGSALALTKAMNRVTTVAAGGDSVKLPAAVAGESVVVINAAAANAMDCFPASGEVINALVMDTALSIVANSSVMFNCVVTGTWNSIVTA